MPRARYGGTDTKEAFVRINVYNGETWDLDALPGLLQPLHGAAALGSRLAAPEPHTGLADPRAELHIPQVKKIEARKVMERKQDPELFTVALDLNVRNLAVITVRQHGRLIETVFVTDEGLDAHRYRYLRRIAQKQWRSGRPVKGEHSNQQLWRHVDRMNEDAAHKVARHIATVCSKYPGCILLFERLRKITANGEANRGA